MTKTYVALGGNIGDTEDALRSALHAIQSLSGIYHLQISHFYLTSPVSTIPQNTYLNAVCCFETTLDARILLLHLQEIERTLGKTKKDKDKPRIIDLDILFFGLERYSEKDLTIPHANWQERLFVLVPLLDLTSTISFPTPTGITHLNISDFLQTFPNLNNETVLLWKE